jgi:hypothetical protein
LFGLSVHLREPHRERVELLVADADHGLRTDHLAAGGALLLELRLPLRDRVGEGLGQVLGVGPALSSISSRK